MTIEKVKIKKHQPTHVENHVKVVAVINNNDQSIEVSGDADAPPYEE